MRQLEHTCWSIHAATGANSLHADVVCESSDWQIEINSPIDLGGAAQTWLHSGNGHDEIHAATGAYMRQLEHTRGNWSIHAAIGVNSLHADVVCESSDWQIEMNSPIDLGGAAQTWLHSGNEHDAKLSSCTY